jgi:hypothetical protein
MPSSSKKAGALTLAATAFEEELLRYEELSAEMQRTHITSEKVLNRAKRALADLAESEQKLAAHVSALLQAMEADRKRQQLAAEESAQGLARVQERAQQFTSLMERFVLLGQRAREVNEPVAAVIARKAEGAGKSELLEGLQTVTARMDVIVSEADALARDAQDGEWQDIAREADALKKQVQAAKNKVSLAQQKFSGVGVEN